MLLMPLYEIGDDILVDLNNLKRFKKNKIRIITANQDLNKNGITVKSGQIIYSDKNGNTIINTYDHKKQYSGFNGNI